MANLQDGVESIRWIAERLDGFRAVADAIDKVGALDRAIAERTAALAATVAKHEAAVGDVKAAQDSLADLAKSHADAIKEHVQKAEQILADAHSEADAVAARAKLEAKGLVDGANAKINAEFEEWSEHIALLRKQAADVQEQAKAAASARDEAVKELADLEQKIGAVKEHAKQLLA